MAPPCVVTIVGGAQVLPERTLPVDFANALPVQTVNCELIEKTVGARLRKKIDRFSQIALVAAAQLAQHLADADQQRVGVFLGNDLAGWNYVEDQLVQMFETHDPTMINPYVATAWFPAAAQGEVTIAHGLRGPSKTFSAGLLSGGIALEYAARMVAANVVDVALAGGIEAPDAPAVLRGLAAGKRISLQHPAAEAAGLLALRPQAHPGTATMIISHMRRSAEAALGDIAGWFAAATAIRCHLPSVDADNQAWNGRLSDLENTLRDRFGARLDCRPLSQNGAEFGSASFPLAVIEANQLAATGIPSLVIGSDFDGLYLASAILPATEGVH